jgi:hypothetical protein
MRSPGYRRGDGDCRRDLHLLEAFGIALLEASDGVFEGLVLHGVDDIDGHLLSPVLLNRLYHFLASLSISFFSAPRFDGVILLDPGDFVNIT